MKTLGEELPLEMARVRDEVLPEYEALGSPGIIPCFLIRADLNLAAKALAEGDIAKMMAAYLALKEMA